MEDVMRNTSDQTTTYENGWNGQAMEVTNHFQSSEQFVIYLEYEQAQMINLGRLFSGELTKDLECVFEWMENCIIDSLQKVQPNINVEKWLNRKERRHKNLRYI